MAGIDGREGWGDILPRRRREAAGTAAIMTAAPGHRKKLSEKSYAVQHEGREGGVIMPDGAVLQGVTMDFHTYDSKDVNTLLIARVLTAGGAIAAEGIGDFGYFADNSQNGPFNLDNIDPVSRDEMFHRTISFEIQPQGDDAWTFDSTVVLSFSDGSTMTSNTWNSKLDQDHRLLSIWNQSDSGVADAPLLQAASVSFTTGDDDKDGDTLVTVRLTTNDDNEQDIATLSDLLRGFPNGYASPPYGLSVVNPVPKDQLWGSTRLIIRIDPNGNDTWRFNAYVELTFFDGSRVKAEIDGVELNEGFRQTKAALWN